MDYIVELPRSNGQFTKMAHFIPTTVQAELSPGRPKAGVRVRVPVPFPVPVRVGRPNFERHNFNI